MKFTFPASALITVLAFTACGRSTSSPAAGSATASRPGGVTASAPTGEIRPSGVMLTPEGFKCEISSIGLPAQIKIGVPAKISVKMDNQSKENWSRYNNKNSPQYAVNLGLRWYQAGSDKAVKESQREFLVADIPAGGSATLEFALDPPGAGAYRLRFELIQEGVGWFNEKGGCKSESNIIVK